MNASMIELTLRFGAATAATAAFVVIAFGVRGRYLAPAPAWKFVGFVMAVGMVWRWAIFALGFRADLGDFGWIVEWVQPSNATIIMLVFFSVAILAASVIKGVRRLYD